MSNSEPQVEEVTGTETENAPVAETPMTSLEALQAKRVGTFSLKINEANLRYIKNQLQGKVQWTGPEEAYLLSMAVITIDSALQGMDPKVKEPVEVQLPSATIETVIHFLRKVSGTGLESASRLFSTWMILRPVIEDIHATDEEINRLKKEAGEK